MESKGKVLVTGAAGFVGKHFVKLLKDNGYEVVAMVRENTNTRYLESLNVEIQKADLRNKDTLYPSFEGVDSVVHLATTMKGPWSEYEESTINGTRRLLEISKEKGIKKFLFISSIAVYDVSGLNVAQITEESPITTLNPSNYEKSKIEAEKVVKEFAKEMSCSILRSGVIYGPEGPVFPPRLGFAFGSNGYLTIGDGNNTIPFVYIHHLTDAIRLALESDHSKGEVFNVVDDQNITQNAYLNAYRSKISNRFKVIHMPYPVMTAFGAAFEFLLGLLKRPTPIRKVYLYLCAYSIKYPNNKLKEKLGWKPETTFTETLEATMKSIEARRANHKVVDLRTAKAPLNLKKSVNVAVIGCGVIAKTHLDILKNIGNLRVVGLCDTNLDMAKDLGRQYGNISAYGSVDELLKEQKVDVVHILTPPQTRKEIVQKVAEKGCHILLEKPMALNAADAKEIITIADKNNVQVCLGHNHLFDPPMIKARQLIAEGAVGDVLHAESCYGFNLGANLGSRYMTAGAENHWSMHLPGKLYQNLISHPISVMTDVIGAPQDASKDVHAVGLSANVVKSMKTDELKILVKNENKAGIVTLSLAVNPRYQYLHIFGTNMCLYVDFLNKTLIKHATPKGIPKAISRALMSIISGFVMIFATFRNIIKVVFKKFTYFDGTEILTKQFYRQLENGGPMPVTAQDGLDSMLIMDEIWKQVEV